MIIPPSNLTFTFSPSTPHTQFSLLSPFLASPFLFSIPFLLPYSSFFTLCLPPRSIYSLHLSFLISSFHLLFFFYTPWYSRLSPSSHLPFNPSPSSLLTHCLLPPGSFPHLLSPSPWHQPLLCVFCPAPFFMPSPPLFVFSHHALPSFPFLLFPVLLAPFHPLLPLSLQPQSCLCPFPPPLLLSFPSSAAFIPSPSLTLFSHHELIHLSLSVHPFSRCIFPFSHSLVCLSRPICPFTSSPSPLM